MTVNPSLIALSDMTLDHQQDQQQRYHLQERGYDAGAMHVTLAEYALQDTSCALQSIAMQLKEQRHFKELLELPDDDEAHKADPSTIIRHRIVDIDYRAFKTHVRSLLHDGAFKAHQHLHQAFVAACGESTRDDMTRRFLARNITQHHLNDANDDTDPDQPFRVHSDDSAAEELQRGGKDLEDALEYLLACSRGVPSQERTVAAVHSWALLRHSCNRQHLHRIHETLCYYFSSVATQLPAALVRDSSASAVFARLVRIATTHQRKQNQIAEVPSVHLSAIGVDTFTSFWMEEVQFIAPLLDAWTRADDVDAPPSSAVMLSLSTFLEATTVVMKSLPNSNPSAVEAVPSDRGVVLLLATFFLTRPTGDDFDDIQWTLSRGLELLLDASSSSITTPHAERSDIHGLTLVVFCVVQHIRHYHKNNQQQQQQRLLLLRVITTVFHHPAYRALVGRFAMHMHKVMGTPDTGGDAPTLLVEVERNLACALRNFFTLQISCNSEANDSRDASKIDTALGNRFSKDLRIAFGEDTAEESARNNALHHLVVVAQQKPVVDQTDSSFTEEVPHNTVITIDDPDFLSGTQYTVPSDGAMINLPFRQNPLNPSSTAGRRHPRRTIHLDHKCISLHSGLASAWTTLTAIMGQRRNGGQMQNDSTLLIARDLIDTASEVWFGKPKFRFAFRALFGDPSASKFISSANAQLRSECHRQVEELNEKKKTTPLTSNEDTMLNDLKRTLSVLGADIDASGIALQKAYALFNDWSEIQIVLGHSPRSSFTPPLSIPTATTAITACAPNWLKDEEQIVDYMTLQYVWASYLVQAPSLTLMEPFLRYCVSRYRSWDSTSHRLKKKLSPGAIESILEAIPELYALTELFFSSTALKTFQPKVYHKSSSSQIQSTPDNRDALEAVSVKQFRLCTQQMNLLISLAVSDIRGCPLTASDCETRATHLLKLCMMQCTLVVDESDHAATIPAAEYVMQAVARMGLTGPAHWAFTACQLRDKQKANPTAMTLPRCYMLYFEHLGDRTEMRSPLRFPVGAEADDNKEETSPSCKGEEPFFVCCSTSLASNGAIVFPTPRRTYTPCSGAKGASEVLWLLFDYLCSVVQLKEKTEDEAVKTRWRAIVREVRSSFMMHPHAWSSAKVLRPMVLLEQLVETDVSWKESFYIRQVVECLAAELLCDTIESGALVLPNICDLFRKCCCTSSSCETAADEGASSESAAEGLTPVGEAKLFALLHSLHRRKHPFLPNRQLLARQCDVPPEPQLDLRKVAPFLRHSAETCLFPLVSPTPSRAVLVDKIKVLRSELADLPQWQNQMQRFYDLLSHVVQTSTFLPVSEAQFPFAPRDQMMNWAAASGQCRNPPALVEDRYCEGISIGLCSLLDARLQKARNNAAEFLVKRLAELRRSDSCSVGHRPLMIHAHVLGDALSDVILPEISFVLSAIAKEESRPFANMKLSILTPWIGRSAGVEPQWRALQASFLQFASCGVDLLDVMIRSSDTTADPTFLDRINRIIEELREDARHKNDDSDDSDAEVKCTMRIITLCQMGTDAVRPKCAALPDSAVDDRSRFLVWIEQYAAAMRKLGPDLVVDLRSAPYDRRNVFSGASYWNTQSCFITKECLYRASATTPPLLEVRVAAAVEEMWIRLYENIGRMFTCTHSFLHTAEGQPCVHSHLVAEADAPIPTLNFVQWRKAEQEQELASRDTAAHLFDRFAEKVRTRHNQFAISTPQRYHLKLRFVNTSSISSQLKASSNNKECNDSAAHFLLAILDPKARASYGLQATTKSVDPSAQSKDALALGTLCLSVTDYVRRYLDKLNEPNSFYYASGPSSAPAVRVVSIPSEASAHTIAISQIRASLRRQNSQFAGTLLEQLVSSPLLSAFFASPKGNEARDALAALADATNRHHHSVVPSWTFDAVLTGLTANQDGPLTPYTGADMSLLAEAVSVGAQAKLLFPLGNLVDEQPDLQQRRMQWAAEMLTPIDSARDQMLLRTIAKHADRLYSCATSEFSLQYLSYELHEEHEEILKALQRSALVAVDIFGGANPTRFVHMFPAFQVYASIQSFSSPIVIREFLHHVCCHDLLFLPVERVINAPPKLEAKHPKGFEEGMETCPGSDEKYDDERRNPNEDSLFFHVPRFAAARNVERRRGRGSIGFVALVKELPLRRTDTAARLNIVRSRDPARLDLRQVCPDVANRRLFEEMLLCYVSQLSADVLEFIYKDNPEFHEALVDAALNCIPRLAWTPLQEIEKFFLSTVFGVHRNRVDITNLNLQVSSETIDCQISYAERFVQFLEHRMLGDSPLDPEALCVTDDIHCFLCECICLPFIHSYTDPSAYVEIHDRVVRHLVQCLRVIQLMLKHYFAVSASNDPAIFAKRTFDKAAFLGQVLLHWDSVACEGASLFAFQMGKKNRSIFSFVHNTGHSVRSTVGFSGVTEKSTEQLIAKSRENGLEAIIASSFREALVFFEGSTETPTDLESLLRMSLHKHGSLSNDGGSYLLQRLCGATSGTKRLYDSLFATILLSMRKDTSLKHTKNFNADHYNAKFFVKAKPTDALRFCLCIGKMIREISPTLLAQSLPSGVYAKLTPRQIHYDTRCFTATADAESTTCRAKGPYVFTASFAAADPFVLDQMAHLCSAGGSADAVATSTGTSHLEWDKLIFVCHRLSTARGDQALLEHMLRRKQWSASRRGELSLVRLPWEVCRRIGHCVFGAIDLHSTRFRFFCE